MTMVMNRIPYLLKRPDMLFGGQLLKAPLEAILGSILVDVLLNTQLLVPEGVAIVDLAVQGPAEQHREQYGRDSIEEPH